MRFRESFNTWSDGRKTIAQIDRKNCFLNDRYVGWSGRKTRDPAALGGATKATDATSRCDDNDSYGYRSSEVSLNDSND